MLQDASSIGNVMLVTLPLLACLTMIACFATLIGSGWWTDEYYDFFRERADGAAFWWDRVAHWSPRPLAELLLYIYGRAVAAAGRPLISPMLGCLWLGLLAALVLPVWLDRAVPARTAAITTRLGLLVLFLSGTQPTEMFFWPAAAMAYVLTLAGVLLTMAPELSVGWRAAGLFIAAGTSEVGAIFTICCGGFAIIVLACRTAGGDRSWRSAGRDVAWLVVPLLLGLAAVLLVHGGRLQAVEIPVTDGSHAGQPAASALAALLEWRLELFGAWPAAAVFRAAIYIGVIAVFSCAGPLRLPASMSPWSVAFAALAASITSLFAAEYHFGLACCERHVALRHCLTLAACAAVGFGLAPLLRFPRRHAMNWSGAAMSALAAWAFAPELPKLLHDHAIQAQVRAARVATWRSGLTPGEDLTFVLPPVGALIHGPGLPPGHYDLGSGQAPPEWPMLFFHKRREAIVRLDPDGH